MLTDAHEVSHATANGSLSEHKGAFGISIPLYPFGPVNPVTPSRSNRADRLAGAPPALMAMFWAKAL